MIREVVGAITAVFVGVVLLWFMMPMLYTTYQSVAQSVNQTDPTIAQMVAIGDGFYLVWPFVIMLVVGYLIFAYSTRIVPFDYGG